MHQPRLTFVSLLTLVPLALAACKVENAKEDASPSTQPTANSGGDAGSDATAGAAGSNAGGDGGADNGGAADAQDNGGAAGAQDNGGTAGAQDNGGAAGAQDNGGAAGSSGAVDPVVTDPAPEYVDPGEHPDCSDAPATDIEVFEQTDVDSSSLAFAGTVSGAVGLGTYYVATADQAIAGPIPTDETSGAFDVTLPLFCGEQTVKLVWENSDCKVAAISRIVRVDCSTEDIRLTLTWDDLGRDYELHLIKPGGQLNDNATDCTWTSCIGSSPDWGTVGDASDDPSKDVDNTGSYGPENIFYTNPEAGTYTVMVEHWSSGGSAESDGQVILNVAGSTYVATVTNLEPHFVWTVGTIEWPSGVVSLDGSTYDCSSDWSSGCIAELP